MTVNSVTNNSDGSQTVEVTSTAPDGAQAQGTVVIHPDGSQDTYDSNGNLVSHDGPGSASPLPDSAAGQTVTQVDTDGDGQQDYAPVPDDGQESDDSDDDSDAADADQSPNSSLECQTEEQFRHVIGASPLLWIGYSNMTITANAQGGVTALFAGQFQTGTGNSTPVPSGADSGWDSNASRSGGIVSGFGGDPAQPAAPRSPELLAPPNYSSQAGGATDPVRSNP